MSSRCLFLLPGISALCIALVVAASTTLCIAQEDSRDAPRKTAARDRPAKQAAPRPADAPATEENKSAAAEDQAPDVEPCLNGPSTEGPCIDPKKIPRFVENSPFDDDDGAAAVKRERRLWANSWLWTKAPDFVVEKWLTKKPDTKGKYVLIEFWATWCGPCRRSLSLLNTLHKKYGDELIVIGVCEEDEQAVRTLNERHPQAAEIHFFSAVDTQKRMKDQLGVWGIPHVILLEPDGYVIWEGFPLQPGYELSEEIIEKVLAVGRKLQADKNTDSAGQ